MPPEERAGGARSQDDWGDTAEGWCENGYAAGRTDDEDWYVEGSMVDEDWRSVNGRVEGARAWWSAEREPVMLWEDDGWCEVEPEREPNDDRPAWACGTCKWSPALEREVEWCDAEDWWEADDERSRGTSASVAFA